MSLTTLNLNDQEWAAASENAVGTEFPSWDIVTSFEVFALKGASAEHQDRPDARTSLTKLAKVFGLRAETLQKEYVAVLPIASALQRQGGLDNRQAWATALNRLQERKRHEDKWPSAALRKAVAHF